MDAILEFLAEVLGEAALQALAPIMFAAIWAAGAFCLVCTRTSGAAAGSLAAGAFLSGLWLTYLWSRGARWARATLFGGSVLGVVSIIVLLLKLPPQ